jgi:hypothetical protein
MWLYERVIRTIIKINLNINNLCEITTDVVLAMIGKKNALRAITAEEMEHALSRASELVTGHCIIHQQ